MWNYMATLKDARPESLKVYLKLKSASLVRNVYSLLAGLMEKPDTIWDRDPMLLNVGNGVVNLATGQLGHWAQGYYMTKQTPVRYRPNAWHSDLGKALDALPDPDELIWLQARFGQAATGHLAPANAGIVIATGGGSNGKSTLFQAVRTALGTYAAIVPEQVLTAAPGAHPTELMTLQGVRMALIEETPEGKYLPTKRLKDLAGNPTISARAMYRDFVTFDATHSLFVTTNYRPLVAEVDHGTWRRLALLTFPLRFRPAHVPLERENERHGDPELDRRLQYGTSQQEAVLTWIVEGAVKRQHRYAELPERIELETKSWQQDTDLLLHFISERTVQDADGMVSAQELFSEFKFFIEDRGHRAWTEQTFAARLSAHPELEHWEIEKRRTRRVSEVSRPAPGFAPFTDAQMQVWEGLRWKDSAPSFPPVQGVQGDFKLSPRE
jgi:putative DNA primase/helicase